MDTSKRNCNLIKMHDIMKSITFAMLVTFSSQVQVFDIQLSLIMIIYFDCPLKQQPVHAIELQSMIALIAYLLRECHRCQNSLTSQTWAPFFWADLSSAYQLAGAFAPQSSHNEIRDLSIVIPKPEQHHRPICETPYISSHLHHLFIDDWQICISIELR